MVNIEHFKTVQEEIESLQAENAKLRDAANVALGWLTCGLDGDWRACDPAELLRAVLTPKAELNRRTK